MTFEVFSAALASENNEDIPYSKLLSVDAESYQDMLIDKKHCSKRVYNCLMRGNIVTYGDLLSFSHSKLLHIRNMGVKGCCELEALIYKVAIEKAYSVLSKNNSSVPDPSSIPLRELWAINGDESQPVSRLKSIVSTRAFNGLRSGNIYYFDDLLSLSLSELKSLRFIGEASIREIEEATKSFFSQSSSFLVEEVPPKCIEQELLSFADVPKSGNSLMKQKFDSIHSDLLRISSVPTAKRFTADEFYSFYNVISTWVYLFIEIQSLSDNEKSIMHRLLVDQTPLPQLGKEENLTTGQIQKRISIVRQKIEKSVASCPSKETIGLIDFLFHEFNKTPENKLFNYLSYVMHENGVLMRWLLLLIYNVSVDSSYSLKRREMLKLIDQTELPSGL